MGTNFPTPQNTPNEVRLTTDISDQAFPTAGSPRDGCSETAGVAPGLPKQSTNTTTTC